MLVRKSALIMFVNVTGAFGGWIALKFIAVYLGSEPLGVVAYALAIVGTCEILGDLGLNAAFVKRVSEGVGVGSIVATYRLLKLALLGLMVAALTAALWVWTVLLGRDLINTTATTILLGLVYSIARALTSVVTLVFDARLETAKTQIALLVEHLTRVPAVIVVALLVAAGRGQGVLTGAPAAWVRFAGAHPAELLAATFVVGGAATLAVALSLGPHERAGAPSWRAARSLFRFALPMLLVSSVALLSAHVDRLMLGFFWSEREVGQYFAAQRFTIVLTILPMAVAGLLFPAVSGRGAGGDRRAALHLTAEAERLTSLLVSPAIAFFAFLSPPIVRVFLSADFQRDATSLFSLLAVLALVQGLYQLHVSLLSGLDRPGTQAASSFLAFGLNIVLNFLFIPDRGWSLLGVSIRGPVGAAAATLLAFTAGLAYLGWQAWRVAGKAPNRHLPVHFFAAAGLGVLLHLSTRVFLPDNALELVAFSTFFLALYLGALGLIGEFRRSDVRRLWDAVHLRQMGRYVRDELGNRR